MIGAFTPGVAASHGKRSVLWALACLVLFALPTLAIDFCHGNHGLTGGDDCPACHQRAASCADILPPSFELPRPVPVATLVLVVVAPLTRGDAPPPVSRGSPLPVPHLSLA